MSDGNRDWWVIMRCKQCGSTMKRDPQARKCVNCKGPLERVDSEEREGKEVSYDIYLNNPETGEAFEVERHWEGGTYAVGGAETTELNVTYNYVKYFNFHELDGKKASDMIWLLQSKVAELGTDGDGDYWKSTPGNTGHALSILLEWAKQHPDGVFEVD